MSRQTGLETLLPVNVRSVVVVLDDGPGEPSGDLASSLGLSARFAELSEEPVVIAAGSRTVLLYEVLKADVDAPWIEVSLAFTPAWSVAGVMGLQGSSDVWMPLLVEAELDTLVEDGPLSATGSVRVSFSGGG